MNGAESLIRTAAAAGVGVCFANPGTTELALVNALDAVPPVRAVLGVFEGVCSGAADGYARMRERPALALYHLGPGFANGIANLHNARRACSPIVNGAAVACPDRVVIDFQGDGGALYTLQALWTQAREQLHVITLLCANRSYRILQLELERGGVERPGPPASALTELSPPHVDWVQLARGMGVSTARADSVASLRESLGRSLAAPGPHLIELVL